MFSSAFARLFFLFVIFVFGIVPSFSVEASELAAGVVELDAMFSFLNSQNVSNTIEELLSLRMQGDNSQYLCLNQSEKHMFSVNLSTVNILHTACVRRVEGLKTSLNDVTQKLVRITSENNELRTRHRILVQEIRAQASADVAAREQTVKDKNVRIEELNREISTLRDQLLVQREWNERLKTENEILTESKQILADRFSQSIVDFNQRLRSQNTSLEYYKSEAGHVDGRLKLCEARESNMTSMYFDKSRECQQCSIKLSDCLNNSTRDLIDLIDGGFIISTLEKENNELRDQLESALPPHMRSTFD